jgi:hypothetical protein
LLFPHFSSFLFVREALRFEEDKRTMSDPRYPIGKYAYDGPLSPEQRTKLIDDIAHAPDALRAAVKGLSPQQIETPYREGGWTLRQVSTTCPRAT